MSTTVEALEDRCLRALRHHLEADDEDARLGAYDFGRAALADGLGMIEMVPILSGAIREALGSLPFVDATVSQRIEGFLLECLSPFEMVYRGAREANQALRQLDERRE